jgi:hypothetical protein
VLLANLGHENVDIAIARGPDLLFARNLSGGSRLFEDALVQRLGVPADKAAGIKETQVTLDPSVRFTDPNKEKASRAALGAAGQILSLLQSAVLFCKSQVRVTGLKLDRVLLCGGGAALAGLPKYLASGLSVPVDLFDPWRGVDTTALSPEEHAELEAHKLESVVALGLAGMASDPEAWSIEILPAKLKKKREFLEGPVWLAVAGVLALGYLGFDAFRTSGRLTEARTRARALESDVKRASQTHHRAEELAVENVRLAKNAELSSNRRAPGAARAHDRPLEKSLPDELWITQISTDLRADPEPDPKARAPDRPIAGRAREGTTALDTARRVHRGADEGLAAVDRSARPPEPDRGEVHDRPHHVRSACGTRGVSVRGGAHTESAARGDPEEARIDGSQVTRWT